MGGAAEAAVVRTVGSRLQSIAWQQHQPDQLKVFTYQGARQHAKFGPTMFPFRTFDCVLDRVLPAANIDE